jgi:KDO2-lipid IV(A) lauroyltransferase
MHASLLFKESSELNAAISSYYRFLAKVFRQIMVPPSDRLLNKRMRWIPHPALDQWLAEGKSILITFGHIGNWEWAGSYLGMQYPDQVCALYKKIKTASIDRLMFNRRLTHVNYLIEIGQIGELLKLMKKKPVMVLMLSDQNPGSDQGLLWSTFLGRETAFVNGPESLGKRYHLPVVYLHIDSDPYGGYELHCSTLFDGKEQVSEGEITQRFATALEQNIRSNPVEWLWSHKRWKRKKL